MPYDGEPVRTIETYANGNRYAKPWVFLHKAGNKQVHASLYISGFPSIALTCSQQLPDDQPTYASVSVDGKRVTVQLTYQVDQQALPPSNHWDPHDNLGLDAGITEIIAAASGLSFESIEQSKLQDKIKKAQHTFRQAPQSHP